MSASKLIFGVVLGAGVATGLLYVTQGSKTFPFVAKAIGEKAQSEVVAPAADDATVAQKEPAPLKSALPKTAVATMQGAFAIQKRIEGGSQTGNATKDAQLRELEREEYESFSPEAIAAKAAQATEATKAAEVERQPASTVIVMDGTAGVDPSAEDKIMEMAVPESVRQEILKNYRRTGQLPMMIGSETK
ncbi:MAG: hypothetical protein AAB250_06480 [Bdellovibrionota bacterium]